MKTKITEEMLVHEEWYEGLNKTTLETLPAFLEKLTTEYEHDYGTVCHAIAAAGVAVMWAMDNSSIGGITGFQASCIGWAVWKHWSGPKDTPLLMVNFKHMLYPQYEDRFNRISQVAWDWVQEEAKKVVEAGTACDSVLDHCQSIVDGAIPFGYKLEETEG